jgi:hypothetical protein
LPSPTAALQAIDGYKHVGPLEHFNQLVKDALVIVRSGLGRSDRPLAASPHVKKS